MREWWRGQWNPEWTEIIAEAWWRTPPRKPGETWAETSEGSKAHFRKRAREFLDAIDQLMGERA